jgi:hypothetical protein
MLLNVETVLRFFDERPPGSPGHATAIVAVAGEDMGVGLLCDYLHRRQLQAEVLEGPCTTGKRAGSRLDRWVRASGAGSKTLYQVEVKNWSAHAIGGVPLPINASLEQVAKYKIDHWQDAWDESSGTFSHPTLKKVLEQMLPPESCDIHEPLVCYWSAMHPTGAEEPLFSQPLSGRWCAAVWVFSMSSYLRSLYSAGDRRLVIPMPQATARLTWLQQLFPAS